MSSLESEIHDLLGDAGLIQGQEVGTRSESWGSHIPCSARCIVRPKSTKELAAVMALCHKHGQSVVTHGGVTGLVKGAISTENDIVISLERMRAIENIDVANRTMTVQAGAVLQTVHEAAEEAGLYYPVDLGARGSATIGGNISTNAGGNGVIRYGMTRDQILGLEAVLADGTIVSAMNSVLKNNTGYDLKQLFIGSEGTLGIVTRAVLRLRPLPQSRNTALVALPDFDRVIQFLQLMEQNLAGSLSAFEVMWNDFYRLVINSGSGHGEPLGQDHPFYVLLESTGSHEELDASQFEQALAAAFEEQLLSDAVIAQSHQQRNDLWGIRDDIECMLKNLHPTLTFDVSLNIDLMDDYVQEVRARLNARFPEARSVFLGHIGDGNIHPVITVGSLDHDVVSQVEEIVYGSLQSRSGVISAEHGIGLEKKPYLQMSRSDVEMELMRKLKKALDPGNLLNPGKIFDLHVNAEGVNQA